MYADDIYRFVSGGKNPGDFLDPITYHKEQAVMDSVLSTMGPLASLITDRMKEEFLGDVVDSMEEMKEQRPEFSLKKREDGLCMFFGERENGTGYCTIYEQRPKVCAEYHTNRCAGFRNIIIPEGDTEA